MMSSMDIEPKKYTVVDVDMGQVRLRSDNGFEKSILAKEFKEYIDRVQEYKHKKATAEQPLEKVTVEKLVGENTIIADDKKKQTIDRLNSVINKEIDNKDIVKTIEYLSDPINEQTRNIIK